MYFRLILDACIDLPIEWHGVDCIWVTLNCIDRLAFGYIPDKNPMIESSTEQNIFGCWMPFEECNSSSAMCKLWIIMMALPTNSWISIDAWCLAWLRKKTDWCQGYSIHLALLHASRLLLYSNNKLTCMSYLEWHAYSVDASQFLTAIRFYLCPASSTRCSVRSEAIPRPPSGMYHSLTVQSSEALAMMLSLKGFHLMSSTWRLCPETWKNNRVIHKLWRPC